VTTPARRRGAVLLAALLATSALVGLAASSSLAEVSQLGSLRVSVEGQISPRALPRSAAAPVAVSFAGRITSVDGSPPPQLEAISIAINRHGQLTRRGIPNCRMGRIDPSTTTEALAACRSSLVGEGTFSANVKLPEQSPFPSQGKVWAFNGRFRGKPALLAHIYGTNPVPTSYVLPFTIEKSRGAYGTVLTASLPRVTGDWGFVTGISMRLARRFSFRGRQQSYLAAGCPAPRGFATAVFPLAQTKFSFEGGKVLTSTLNRTCLVRG
jgi:hypothetical protein